MRMNYTPKEPPRAMSAAEIEEILPHRYPFALVDKILDYTPGQWARGVKCVTRTEPFFEGHFPGHPVMPGVLILEALAQTGAVAALSLPENRGKLALFGGVKNARFRRQVIPGDVLILECELIEQIVISGCLVLTGKILVNEKGAVVQYDDLMCGILLRVGFCLIVGLITE